MTAATTWRRSRSANAASRGPRPDADVCEAIDFLEYYAQHAIRLATGVALIQLRGERNSLHYRPGGRGGDRALELPVREPHRHGGGRAGDRQQRLPETRPSSRPAALALLPGEGDVGAALAAHPGVHTIAFTGSGAVGLEILCRAAEPANVTSSGSWPRWAARTA